MGNLNYDSNDLNLDDYAYIYSITMNLNLILMNSYYTPISHHIIMHAHHFQMNL